MVGSPAFTYIGLRVCSYNIYFRDGPCNKAAL